MTISMHAMAVGTFAPMLRSLSGFLDKAAQQVAAKGGDPNGLVTERLAEDMIPLAGQIQIATDHAKGAVARLTGRTPPKYEDTERTIDELKARIEKTLAYVEEATPEMFEGAEARTIAFPLFGEMRYESNGLDYMRVWAFGNFYFHVVTAYAILRHDGAQIGKADFLAHAADAVKQGRAA